MDGFSKVFMVFLMENHGKSWKIMENHGKSIKKSMENPSMDDWGVPVQETTIQWPWRRLRWRWSHSPRCAAQAPS